MQQWENDTDADDALNVGMLTIIYQPDLCRRLLLSSGWGRPVGGAQVPVYEKNIQRTIDDTMFQFSYRFRRTESANKRESGDDGRVFQLRLLVPAARLFISSEFSVDQYRKGMIDWKPK